MYIIFEYSEYYYNVILVSVCVLISDNVLAVGTRVPVIICHNTFIVRVKFQYYQVTVINYPFVNQIVIYSLLLQILNPESMMYPLSRLDIF